MKLSQWGQVGVLAIAGQMAALGCGGNTPGGTSEPVSISTKDPGSSAIYSTGGQPGTTSTNPGNNVTNSAPGTPITSSDPGNHITTGTGAGQGVAQGDGGAVPTGTVDPQCASNCQKAVSCGNSTVSASSCNELCGSLATSYPCIPQTRQLVQCMAQAGCSAAATSCASLISTILECAKSTSPASNDTGTSALDCAADCAKAVACPGAPVPASQCAALCSSGAAGSSCVSTTRQAVHCIAQSGCSASTTSCASLLSSAIQCGSEGGWQ